MITRKRLNLRHFLVNCERMSLLHAVPTGFWTFFWVGEDCQAVSAAAAVCASVFASVCVCAEFKNKFFSRLAELNKEPY